MEMHLCRNVGELATGFVNEGFAVRFETLDNPEFDFPTIVALALSCACRQLPFCPLRRRKPTANYCFALTSWDFAALVASSLLPFHRLLLEQPCVGALATRGKFAYGFLAVLHYPVAMILLPGSLVEMRR